MTTKRILLGVTIAKSLGFLRGLPAKLIESGWEVHVVSSPGPELDELAAAGVHVHAIAMAREPSPVRDLISLVKWLRVVFSVRPHIVFVGTPKAGLLGLLAARVCGTGQRLYHLRGLRMETLRGTRRRVQAVFEWACLRLATRTVAVSPSLKTRVAELGLARLDRIDVLGHGSSNGVDTNRFFPGEPDEDFAAQVGLTLDVPVIGFVGRLTRDKGVPELVAASRALARRSVSHQLVVAGDTEDDSAEDLFANLKDDGVTVRILGPVSDTVPLFRLIDVFCLPTLREGFPNVVLEASASGVCVVSTTATGAVDAVINGETGLSVAPKDPDALAAALERVLVDAELRRRLGDGGRAWVTQYFERDVYQVQMVSYLDDRIR